MAAPPGPHDDQRLITANETIGILTEDVRKLSTELRSKSNLLISALDVPHKRAPGLRNLPPSIIQLPVVAHYGPRLSSVTEVKLPGSWPLLPISIPPTEALCCSGKTPALATSSSLPAVSSGN